MAKNPQSNGTIRLIVHLAVILGTVAAAWGIVSYQVKDNTSDIEKLDLGKLDKEVFQMYLDQQKEVAEARDKKLDRMDEKLDGIIEWWTQARSRQLTKSSD